MPRYECNIAVEVEGDSYEEAALHASRQFRDPTVDYWMIGVKNLDTDGHERVIDERDLANLDIL